MAQRVGHGLLGDPEHRGVHRCLEGREVAGELDLDARAGRRGPGQPLQVRDAGLRGVVGGLLVAQHPHHRAHLGQCARRLRLDHLEGLDRRRGTARGQGSPCLGLDRDRRDVVGHRVVQLARQPDPLLGLRLLEPAAPVAVLGARGHAEGHRGHQHGRPADQVPDPGPAQEEPGRGGDQDDREPCQHLTPGSPPEQRVRQDQEVDHRVHVERRRVGDDQADVHGGGHAEGHRHHHERARTPPQQCRRQPHRHQQGQPRKPEVLAQRDLQHGAHGDGADQHPVPPHPRRWRRGARFVQDGPQRVDHRPSLGKARRARTGRKSGSPLAESTTASRPRRRCAGHARSPTVEELAGVPDAGRTPRRPPCPEHSNDWAVSPPAAPGS